MSVSGRVSSCTSTPRSSAGSSIPAIESPATGQSAGRGAGRLYLFVAIDDASRLGQRASLPGRDRRLRDRVPAMPASASTPSTGSGSSASHRQRRLLPRRWRENLRQARDRRPQDQALPATDQRQSRTLHPHPARALGVRLPLHARARAATAALPTANRLLQSLPATPRPRRADPTPARQQPPWDKQLIPLLPVPRIGRGGLNCEVDKENHYPDGGDQECERHKTVVGRVRRVCTPGRVRGGQRSPFRQSELNSRSAH